MQSLQPHWVSQASAEQRTCRADGAGHLLGSTRTEHGAGRVHDARAAARPQRFPSTAAAAAAASAFPSRSRRPPRRSTPPSSPVGCRRSTPSASPLGAALAELPVDVHCAKMLVLGELLDGRSDADARRRPVPSPLLKLGGHRAGAAPAAATARLSLLSPLGDTFTLLNVHDAWVAHRALPTAAAGAVRMESTRAGSSRCLLEEAIWAGARALAPRAAGGGSGGAAAARRPPALLTSKGPVPPRRQLSILPAAAAAAARTLQMLDGGSGGGGGDEDGGALLARVRRGRGGGAVRALQHQQEAAKRRRRTLVLGEVDGRRTGLVADDGDGDDDEEEGAAAAAAATDGGASARLDEISFALLQPTRSSRDRYSSVDHSLLQALAPGSTRRSRCPTSLTSGERWLSTCSTRRGRWTCSSTVVAAARRAARSPTPSATAEAEGAAAAAALGRSTVVLYATPSDAAVPELGRRVAGASPPPRRPSRRRLRRLPPPRRRQLAAGQRRRRRRRALALVAAALSASASKPSRLRGSPPPPAPPRRPPPPPSRRRRPRRSCVDGSRATRRPRSPSSTPPRRRRRRRRRARAAARRSSRAPRRFVAAPPPAHRLSRIKFADLAGHFAVGGGGSGGGGSGGEGEADYQPARGFVAQHPRREGVGDEFDAQARLASRRGCWGSVEAPDGAPPATKGGEASWPPRLSRAGADAGGAAAGGCYRERAGRTRPVQKRPRPTVSTDTLAKAVRRVRYALSG